jgi:hypothetical protein
VCRATACLLLAAGSVHASTGAPGCAAREYVYAGERLLSVVDTPTSSVTVTFTAAGASTVESGTLNVSVRLSSPDGPLACPVTFTYLVTAGSATANVDYTPPALPWTGTFAAGVGDNATVTVPVVIVPDTLYEGAETFSLQLTAVTGGGVGSTPSFTVTIQNDDPAPSVSVDDVGLAEGQSGTTNAVFTLSLSAPSGLDASVNYATANGTAVTPGDYGAVSGLANFSAGTTTRTVSVPVVGDGAYEPNETFTLALASPAGATLGDASGVGTIVNDDAPGVSLDEVRGPEGPSGSSTLTFTVSIEGPTPVTVSVPWSAAVCTATAADFAPASGSVTFPPNTTAPQTFSVTVFGDTQVEGHEVFTAGLGAPTNAYVKDAQGHGSLENDDVPAFTAARPSADFDLDGNPDLLWFNVTSGNLVSWLMVGVNRASGAFLNPAAVGDLNWAVVGTADYGHTTQPDVLWRNSTSGRLVVWQMDGLNRHAGLFTNPDIEPDLDWRVMGTGRFTPGGTTVGGDILWRHAGTGALRVWAMDGVNRTQVIDITGLSEADANWQVIGTGDYDGDGDADLWWRHAGTGQLRLWRLNGTVYEATVTPTPSVLADLNWVPVSTADLDRDGDADLLWRNANSGSLVMWLMNAGARQCGVFLNPSATADPNWRVVGPR